MPTSHPSQSVPWQRQTQLLAACAVGAAMFAWIAVGVVLGRVAYAWFLLSVELPAALEDPPRSLPVAIPLWFHLVGAACGTLPAARLWRRFVRRLQPPSRSSSRRSAR